MSELSDRLRSAANHFPAQAQLLREAATELEFLERELKHQKDLVEGYKRLTSR